MLCYTRPTVGTAQPQTHRHRNTRFSQARMRDADDRQQGQSNPAEPRQPTHLHLTMNVDPAALL